MSKNLTEANTNSLAIVIPAYKEKYFEKTLKSLAAQTNKNFTVYIGDDNSPFDLFKIVEDYLGLLDIKYTRFADNIGAKNLVRQWERCVNLTKNEKWIWLFSDDDIADSSCVESFFDTLQKKNNQFDVYRFNVTIIDENGKFLGQVPFGPDEETSEEMAYNLLRGKRSNSMPDHIFTREIYDLCGGFVFTEYAQGADWATSILFSKNKGMCIIPEARVYWRFSGTNISSIASSKKDDMMIGFLQFVEWVLKHFEYLKIASSGITFEMMHAALRTKLRMVMIDHYKGFNLNKTFTLLSFYIKKLNLSNVESLKELFKIVKSSSPIIDKLRRLIGRFKSVKI